MDVKEYIKSKLIELDIPLYGLKNISRVDLIVDGYKAIGVNSSVMTSFNKKYLPYKPKNQSAIKYITSLDNKSNCCLCNQVLSVELFHKSSSNTNNIASRCKKCTSEYLKSDERKETSKTYRRYYDKSEHGLAIKKYHNNKRRCAKLQRTPKWADLSAIQQFYEKCPKGYHVDHIIPLQGKEVSGLHILSNLQYLLAAENFSKNNKFYQ